MDLKEFEEQRQSANKKFYLGLGIAIPIGVIGGFLTFFLEDLSIIGFVLIAVAVLVVGYASTKRNALKKKFKEQVLTVIVKDKFPDGVYTPSRGFSWDEMSRPGFFRSPDRYTTEDMVTASYNGISFMMSDYDLKEKHVHSNGKTTTVTYDTYAKGKFIVFDLQKNLNLIVKVIEQKLLFGSFGTGLTKVKPESIEFNKKFTTLASDEESAFYILTPQIQLKLLEIEKRFSGQIYFAFINSKLYLAINDNSDGMELKFDRPITEESLNYIYDELNVPVDIINGLRLDDDKFKNYNL